MATKKEDKNPQLDVAHLTEILQKADYINRRTLYFHNFMRGVVFGAGSVIGATVLIALLVWVLSLFDTVPLIGPFLEKIKISIESTQ